MKNLLRFALPLLVAVALFVGVTSESSVAQSGPYYWSLYVRTLLNVYGTFSLDDAATLVADSGSAITQGGKTLLSSEAVAIVDTITALPYASKFVLYGDSTGILQLPAGTDGQIVMFICNDTSEALFVDGENLYLSGNANIDSNDVLILMYNTDLAVPGWVEVVHTVN